MRTEARRVLGFLVFGACLFAADLALLSVLIAAGSPPFPARIASWAFAASLSWILNRRFTFRTQAPPRLSEWATFLAGASIAGAANIAVFGWVLGTTGLAPTWLGGGKATTIHLMLSAAAGSLAGLSVSYLSARLVLLPKSATPAPPRAPDPVQAPPTEPHPHLPSPAQEAR